MPTYLAWNPGCGQNINRPCDGNGSDNPSGGVGGCQDVTWFWLGLAAVAAIYLMKGSR